MTRQVRELTAGSEKGAAWALGSGVPCIRGERGWVLFLGRAERARRQNSAFSGRGPGGSGGVPRGVPGGAPF